MCSQKECVFRKWFFIDASLKCYCEHKNGATGKNGIMCGKDGRYQRTGYCSSDEWCTGTVNAHDAVVPELNKAELCTKGGKFKRI